MIKLSDKRVVFALGLLIGAFFFLCIYGTERLAFTNDGWLRVGGDLTQNYSAWRAYRLSDWRFPFCITDMLSYPKVTSIMFTDPIPLFALFFKILSPVLPDTFQYFGMFGLIAYMLQGGFAALLLRQLKAGLAASLAGAAMFSFMPVMIHKMFTHTALASQWIILAGLLLWFSESAFKKKGTYTAVWCAFFFITSWIHLYYVPMLIIFLFARTVEKLIARHKVKPLLIEFFLPVLTAVAAVFLIGGFSGTNPSGGVPDVYSSDLNAFFNSAGRFSRFLPALPVGEKMYESFAYMGIGVLALCLSAAGLSIYRVIKTGQKTGPLAWVKLHPRRFVLVLTVIASLLLGFGNIVTWFGTELWRYPLPSVLLLAWGTFRATGRFIWIAMYILPVFSIVYLTSRLKNFAALAVVPVALFLQFADVNPFGLVSHETPEYVSPLKDGLWREPQLSGKAHMFYGNDMSDLGWMFPLADYAIENNMTVNDFYFSRSTLSDDLWNALNRYLAGEITLEELKVENWSADAAKTLSEYESPDPDTLYVFRSEGEVWDTLGSKWKADGYWLGVK